MTQHEKAAPSPRPTVPLQVVELSDEFVKLLGVDRRSAESLQPLFAARCQQLLPAPQGTHGNPNRGAREALGARVAPRAVLLTSSGSLFLLKHRGGSSAVVMERLEFGAYLQRHGKHPGRRVERPILQHLSGSEEAEEEDDDDDFHFLAGSSVPQDEPSARIDVVVDERCLPNGKQSICITGWACRAGKWARHAAAPSRSGATQTLAGTATSRAVASGGGGTTMTGRFVVALQFHAKSGLLAGVLALRLKQVADHFRKLDVVKFIVSSQSYSLHHAQRNMALCRVASKPFVSSSSLSLSPRRVTVRDMLCCGLEVPVTVTLSNSDDDDDDDDGEASTHAFAYTSSKSSSSAASSRLSSMYTTDTEAERGAGLAELGHCCFSTDHTLQSDETFNARLVELLDDIARVEGLLVMYRAHGQPTLL
ncbi:hypothetical protein TraAM80_01668 [Trypanosoma rangeli]|uniref:Uncharacterized protein n=1 Tax=Trypanosoma rangeli TaxID=5698 RepID=A0A422NXT7_TRYRA|nr:uncharacterized protein TraAM80_01668 [Trypanosoma rangeli]RNF10229.1 hypothetical protein TraAM80_01668 [Trypanosoma rangeli]|eukprot:RNF10229.1 hypothetical protein TraAM80_01668 [Trypanosoma rangeli]